jgi:WhiB family redox-sensing transcriptional regulator
MSWESQAACHPDHRPQGMTRSDWAAIWFPEPGKPLTRALNICAVCPVRAECLDAGRREQGVWGGMSGRQRRAISYGLADLPPINHGTEGGYQTHKRRGETPCDACKIGKQDATRARRYRAEANAVA